MDLAQILSAIEDLQRVPYCFVYVYGAEAMDLQLPEALAPMS